MKVAILGDGVEGKSAAKYWKNLGHQITIRDIKDGRDYLENLNQFDLIVRSPGVRPDQIVKANPDLDTTKITSVTNQFLQECPAKVIGVTGTKGKGTTATLIAKILEAAGHTTHLGGNIGVPALDLLPDIQPEDWVVLELSSFQLIDARYSPHVAVMLMIAPDHLDWHPDMDEYVTAKQNIFAHQGPGDRAIYNAANPYSRAAGLGAPGDQMPYNAKEGAWVDLATGEVKLGSTAICRTADIALPGRHNWDNVCAAIAAVWPIVQTAKPIQQVVSSFTGLPHRLEKVREVQGVTYINDSFSTNPETAIAAIRAYNQPKVIILGGSDKGASFGQLAAAVAASSVRAVILIGATAPQIKAALHQVGYAHILLASGDMDAIVKLAAQTAQPGDVVLLSPACASFDLFTNYKERGELFAKAVAAL